MPAPVAKPVRSLSEGHKRARRIFAHLVGGESMRAAAPAGFNVREALALRWAESAPPKAL
jgi:hypothetical protein